VKISHMTITFRDLLPAVALVLGLCTIVASWYSIKEYQP